MERNYVLVSDDSCDMPPEFYTQHQIPLLYIHYNIDGVTYKGDDMSIQEFYRILRTGKMPTTAQAGVDDVVQLMEPILLEGKDVLYLAFSSGLSGTCNSGMVAAQLLGEKYPQRKILVLDSLCASMGEGLLLYKMIQKRDAGATLEELFAYGEELRHKIAHYVTAEDLMHLHRGGRVSKASAVVGGMLGIKPMIHMNETGHLINIGKVRGRKQSLEEVVKLMEKAVGNAKNDIFFVSHSDALEDAQYVAELAKKRFGVQDCIIHYIGPVIGSHTGPGTVALFLVAEGK